MFDATNLIVPVGQATGLREPTPAERSVIQFPRAADRIEIIPTSEWGDLIDDDMDLRQFADIVYSQGSVGSCASEAKDQATAITLHASGAPYVRFNPYGTYGRVNGGRDAGSSIMANLRFGQQYGCFPEAVWPRSKGWSATPTEEAYKAAAEYRIDEVFEVGSWTEFGSALLKGFVVVFGYSGHSIVAVKLLSTTRFAYLNSWGANWGDNGVGTIANSSIYWPYGAYALRTTSSQQDTPPTPKQAA